MTDILSDSEAERLTNGLLKHEDDPDAASKSFYQDDIFALAHKVKQLLSRQWLLEKKLLNAGYFPCELCGEWLGRLAMQLHQCPQEEPQPPEPPKEGL